MFEVPINNDGVGNNDFDRLTAGEYLLGISCRRSWRS